MFTRRFRTGCRVQSDFAVTTTRTDVDISIKKPTLKPGESGTVTVSVLGTPQTPTGTATVTFDGTVVEVNHAAGEQVALGVVLFSVEPDSEEAAE